MGTIRLALGHRCSAHRLFKIVDSKIHQLSVFDSCFGDLSGHIGILDLLCKDPDSQPAFIPLTRQTEEEASGSRRSSYRFFKRAPTNHLLWAGKRWIPSNYSFLYAKDFTDNIGMWSDCEMLTTTNKHFIITRPSHTALNDNQLYLNESDLNILNSIRDGASVELFYLARLVQLNNASTTYRYIGDQIQESKPFLAKHPALSLHIFVPYITQEEYDHSKPHIVFSCGRLTLVGFPIPLKLFQWKGLPIVLHKTTRLGGRIQLPRYSRLYDIDVKMPPVQAHVASAMIEIKRIYA